VDLEKPYENVKPCLGIFYGQGVNTMQGLCQMRCLVHAQIFGKIRFNQSRRGTCCVIVQMGVESP